MAGGIITTGAHPKAFWPGVKAWWGNAYDEFPEEWRLLVNDILDSTQNYEEIVQDTGFGLAPVKAQGQTLYYEANVQGYTGRATHVTYALGYQVTMEELQDNLYEKVSKARAGANAFSQRLTRENVVANVLNRAFNSTYAIADGQAFFSTAHPLTNGGTMSNRPSVDVDLSEASLEDGLVAIAGFQNDKGLPIQVMPDALVVSRQNIFNAQRILKSTYQNDTANNAINAIKAMNALPSGVYVNHYLTDVNAWFIKNRIPNGSGFVLFDRMPLEFDQDNDFSTKNALASSIQRFSVLVSDPRCYYGTQGAT